MPKLQEVREQAWKFYQKWRKEKTHSPALKSNIRVSLLGWKHLSGSDKARKRRTYQDAMLKRLLKLPLQSRTLLKKGIGLFML